MSICEPEPTGGVGPQLTVVMVSLVVVTALGVNMYACLEGMNYWHVRCEKRDLLRLLSAALATDPAPLTATASSSDGFRL